MKNTLVLKINPRKPDKKIIALCAKAIRSGSLVAFPTETVYGIGANLLKKRAIERLYKVKNRPGSKPFTVHIASLATMRSMGCKASALTKKLITKFWPGPLTIVLKGCGGKKIGFRMPANRAALELIKSARIPMVAPSANISGSPAPDNAASVLKQFDGKIDIILDGGRTDVGIESTVIDLTVTPAKILREGAVKRKDLLKALTSRSLRAR